MDSELLGYGPRGLQSSARDETATERVFQQIRADGETARVDIARDLGISPATVTTITADLMARGLIEETAARTNATVRGRPRVALQLRAQAHVVAGLKLGDKVTTLVLLDFQGRQLAETALRQPLHFADTNTIVQLISKALDQALAQAGLSRADLSAIGIGVPGFVDAQLGLVHWSPILDRRMVPLRALLEDALDCPIAIDNDANLLALAELWFGVGRSIRDFIVVTIEQGVGMGVVIGNQLYQGTRGCGMEFGHMKVQPEGALCRCGQRGCLEAYVADYALLREAEMALPLVPAGSPDRLEKLFGEAKAGNLAAQSIFRRAGKLFGIGLANIVNIFDPELVILSGEQLRYDYLYSREVREMMEMNSLELGHPPVELRLHKWEDQLWAKGAAAFALDRVSRRVLVGGAQNA
ncbi:Sugar kinase of the NBD/HSP70 family, may contain an N-terminal HTH domain [Monaibacterium marinum]|uniref:Sugar kinase of the NBD/HSP70 family, may contain an N-terminal HTH domain n=1 Tax=Pontivivens marinum TaxID=1690039 RepID=A0A2C9CUN8_9RHOB|nr:ROK family transcriptional regulator [Monaibacterium marinum]SOH95076.1 Sugar kinase of the NBD/HSP70 family, may contain an N-terminal HTH domain [Monaibacterium marinum]